jgi:FMN-dependent NADH-azoreductase
MKKILNITSSPRGNASYSIKLANILIEKLRAVYPDAIVTTHDLAATPFKHLEEAHLVSFNTPADNHTDEDKEAIRHSDQAIKEIMEADILIIGAPMYNFGVPSALKAWIDHIVRAKKTFSYSEKGAEGLIKGKKIYLAVATGGIYSAGAASSIDFVVPYLKMILGFIGMTDITVLRAEGIAMPDMQAVALEKAMEAVEVQA